MSARLHLTLRVGDLRDTRRFYGQLLGCEEANLTESSVDFSFFGHHLTCRVGPPRPDAAPPTGPAFGARVPEATFFNLAARLEAAGVPFLEKPSSQPVGKVSRWWMVVCDPSGNALELRTEPEPSRAFDA
jgi:extradiol dioxygenase family protein